MVFLSFTNYVLEIGSIALGETLHFGLIPLFASCYLAEEYREEARTAIRKIFDINRQYEPDAVQDPQPYRDLAVEVKAALPKPMSEKLFGGVKKWLWIGGGTLATTGIAVLLSKEKSTPEPDLPVPPELP